MPKYYYNPLKHKNMAKMRPIQTLLSSLIASAATAAFALPSTGNIITVNTAGGSTILTGQPNKLIFTVEGGEATKSTTIELNQNDAGSTALSIPFSGVIQLKVVSLYKENGQNTLITTVCPVQGADAFQQNTNPVVTIQTHPGTPNSFTCAIKSN